MPLAKLSSTWPHAPGGRQAGKPTVFTPLSLVAGGRGQSATAGTGYGPPGGWAGGRHGLGRLLRRWPAVWAGSAARPHYWPLLSLTAWHYSWGNGSERRVSGRLSTR
jgi:hypothetical protein